MTDPQPPAPAPETPDADQLDDAALDEVAGGFFRRLNPDGTYTRVDYTGTPYKPQAPPRRPPGYVSETE